MKKIGVYVLYINDIIVSGYGQRRRGRIRYPFGAVQEDREHGLRENVRL